MIIPFLNFQGKAAEAIALYESVFDVQNKKVARYSELPADMKSHFPEGTENYVLHAEMTINDTPVWMGDTPEKIAAGAILSLSVPCKSQEEARSAFDKLKVGGKVHMELAPTFYSPLFGMVEDRFGIIWHLIC